MSYRSQNQPALYTPQRERKYLNAYERNRFWDALSVLDDLRARSFCAMLYWTGCWPSEALSMESGHIDVHSGYAVIATLKKRGKKRGTSIRLVPIPPGFIRRLIKAHDFEALSWLWPFSRTKAWGIVRTVMQAAKIEGIRACARGLRHAFGINAVLCKIPETRIQAWMGHASLETTRIYLDVMDAEDHALAARMWETMKGAA